jgi:hypothetical protein
MTLNSLNKLEEKEYDSLPFRINFIKTLLGGKEVKPMVEFDMTDTEYFMGKNIKENSDSETSKKIDETISKVKNEKFDRLNYVKLKSLNEQL